MKGMTKACFVASSVSRWAIWSVARSAKSKSEFSSDISALLCVVLSVNSFLPVGEGLGPKRFVPYAPCEGT